MIPFAILGGKINTTDGEALEFRILELSPDCFTARFPKGYFAVHGETEKLVLSFFDWENKKYTDIEIKQFELLCDKENEFYDVFTFKCNLVSYKNAAKKLTDEYLKYIDCRLEMDDVQMSEAMCGFPAKGEEVFARDIAQQLDIWAEGIVCHKQPTGVKLGISLENNALIEMYLSLKKEEFVSRYFESAGLKGHPYATIIPDRLYIGNPYCINLMPEKDIFERIMVKAQTDKIALTLVVAPVPEWRAEITAQHIRECIRIYHEGEGSHMSNSEECIQMQSENLFEIQVNDYGMQRLLEKEGVNVVRGPMMYKDKRDPRAEYYESKKSGLMRSQKELYFPMYQTNTGTFCTLYAAVHNGSRQNIRRVKNCPHYCEKAHFLYPLKYNMIGRYNSLFGIDFDSLKNPMELERSAIELGIDRIVLNLVNIEK